MEDEDEFRAGGEEASVSASTSSSSVSSIVVMASSWCTIALLVMEREEDDEAAVNVGCDIDDDLALVAPFVGLNSPLVDRLADCRFAFLSADNFALSTTPVCTFGTALTDKSG